MPEKSLTSWHNLTVTETLRRLNVNPEKGLTKDEVLSRRADFGFNRFPKEKPPAEIILFFRQFKNPLVFILSLAGFMTLALKAYTDAIVIFCAVFLNAIIGFFQERKTSRALETLYQVVKHEAKVMRDKRLKVIDSERLVPGDIIMLSQGDSVPADSRLIDCHDLKINEATLTGEWLPVEKSASSLALITSVADRTNMAYMSTTIEAGKAKAVVVNIGMDTEMGRIAEMVKSVKEGNTPYQNQLLGFSKTVGVLVFLIALGIFGIGVAFGVDFNEIFVTAVAIAVAAVPEGLVIALTVILAIGMEKILKKQGLVKNMAAAETLGSTSVICTDKTGTLTEGKMKVRKVLLPQEILKGKPADKNQAFLALKIAFLTSEAFIENPVEPKDKWLIRGSSLEKAVLEAMISDDFQELPAEERATIFGLGKAKKDEILFNSANKFSASLYQGKTNEHWLYFYGSPEKTLEMTKSFLGGKRKQVLKTADRERLKQEIESLAAKGLRLIGVAYKKLPRAVGEIERELHDLVFVGFIILEDPLRHDVKEVVDRCQKMGIRLILATGDHKLTAKAIAEDVGLGKLNEENILEGKDLDKLSVEELDKVLEKIVVYARVEPKHKMRIIRAWQERGEVVAMTGDGVNDAPALRQADIGVGLGSGTEVAKESSDLVLLNDSFSIIISAIEEGRVILDNIRKVITYLLSDSLTEVILVVSSILLGLPLPVTASQILWVNLVEDSLPSFALVFEPKEKDVGTRKPRKKGAPLITAKMKVIIFVIGTVTNLFLLLLYLFLTQYSGYTLGHIRTIIFICLAFSSLFFVASCRSLRKNIWQINPFSNIMIIGAWVFGVLMLLAAVYLKPLQLLLKTEPLSLIDWQIVVVLGVVNIVMIEVVKWLFTRKEEKKLAADHENK